MLKGSRDEYSCLVSPLQQKGNNCSPFFNLSYLQNNYSKQYLDRPYADSVSPRSALWFNANDPKGQKPRLKSDA